MSSGAKFRRGSIYLALVMIVGGLIFLTFRAVEGGILDVDLGLKETKSIFDSKALVEVGENSSASWMDENNIAFFGRVSQYELGLYIWNVEKRPELYKIIRDSSKLKYLCAEKGELNYSSNVEISGPVFVSGGRPGFEVEKILRPSVDNREFDYGQQANQTIFGSKSISGRRCGIYVDASKRGRSWVANYTNDIYLDFGKRWHSEVVSFESREGGEGVSLPIVMEGEVSSNVETPAWDDSFFVWSKSVLPNSNGARATISGYRIFRTGRFERISIDNSSAILGGDIIPYRDGYLVSAANGGVADLGGIYFLENGNLKKKISGNFLAISLSPSGCRLAVAELSLTVPEQAQLKIIQLCDGAHHD